MEKDGSASYVKKKKNDGEGESTDRFYTRASHFIRKFWVPGPINSIFRSLSLGFLILGQECLHRRRKQ